MISQKRKRGFSALGVSIAFLIMIGIVLCMTKAVKAEEIEKPMQWQSVLKVAQDCTIENNFYSNKDVILAEQGGDVEVTFQLEDGYAVYYRKFKRGSHMFMSSSKYCEENGLIESGNAKKIVFELPEEHTTKNYSLDCYPFTYIVLKKSGDRYYTFDGAEFDVANAETKWKYNPSLTMYKDNDSWFYGFVGQIPQEDLNLDSAAITNLSQETGSGLEFKSTTLNYPKLVVNNSNDMVMTAAADWNAGGEVVYTIDGGEEIKPDSEGKITIPGISEVGDKRIVTATTVPTTDKAFEYKSKKYTFTITRGKATAPLKSISVTGGTKDIQYQNEIYYYEVAVKNEDSSLEIKVESSEDSKNILYQIDNGEKENIPENGVISLKIFKNSMPCISIYTSSDSASELYQDGVYTIQVMRKYNQEEILSKAAVTKDVMANPEKTFLQFNDDSSPWVILDLNAYGKETLSSYIGKEEFMQGVSAQSALERIKTGKLANYDVQKFIPAFLATGYTLNELTAFQVNQETTLNLMDGMLGNFASLWVLSDDNMRQYVGEDVVLERALELVKRQNSDGALIDTHGGGCDGTAMSVQGFSTYYYTNDEIKAAVDKALGYLSGLQNRSTGLVPYSGYGYYSSETISQYIVALASLGIDANDSEAFNSDSGLGLVDILIDNFMLEDGTFEHISGQGSNGMATEQAFRALVAYKGYLESGNKPFLVYNPRTSESYTGTEAVAEAITAIDAIGEVSKTSGDAITAAKTAYDALTDVEKNSMPDRYEQKLIEAEGTYEPFKAVVETEKLIGNIGEVTLDKEQNITDARAAYEALTDEQKGQVENFSVLEQAEKSLAADKQTVEDIQDRLNDLLPLESLTTGRESEAKELQTQIKALRKDLYDAVENAEQIDAVVNRIQDLKDAENVEALIDAIKTVDSLDKEQAVLEAQTAYHALGEEKQALLKEGYAETLNNAVLAIQKLKEDAMVQNVMDNISKLLNDQGEISVTLEDGEFLTNVRNLYDQAEKAGLGERITNRNILFQAEEMYTTMVVADAQEKFKALPDNNEITGIAEDGSDIVMTQKQLDSILEAQLTYEALTEEQKAKLAETVGEEVMNNYRLNVQTAEIYEGYVEAVLQVFIQKVMDLELPLSDASVNAAKENLAAAQKLMEQYETNEAAQAYLNSVEGFPEKLQEVENEITKVETDLAAALAVDQMIAALPAEINSDEERTAVQDAVDAIRQSYENLNKEAKSYVMRMADVDTVELLIANYDKYKEEAAEIIKAIQAAEAKAAENLVSDTTVAAVKQAQNLLDHASVTAKAIISQEIKAVPGNLQASIQQEKNKKLQENTVAVIKETIPYDVVVEIQSLTSGDAYKALKDGMKTDKKAEIAEAVSVSAYQLVWDEEQQEYVQKDWIPDGGFTVTLRTDSKLEGNEVFLGQYTDEGDLAYLAATVGEGTVTFKADELTAYAIGLKEKETEEPKAPEDNKTPDDDTKNPVQGNQATGNGNKTATASGSGSSGKQAASSGSSTQIPKTGDRIAEQVNADLAVIFMAVGCLTALCMYKRKERNR